MNYLLNFLRLLFWGLLSLGLLGAGAAYVLYLQLVPTLPSTEVLKDVRLQVPLRVYASGHELIGEYGEMKRTPLIYKDIPERMIKAVLAAEDDRFFTHPGLTIRACCVQQCTWFEPVKKVRAAVPSPCRLHAIFS